MKRIRIAVFMLTLIMLTIGCATYMAPSYTPDYTALDNLKRQKVSKIAIESVEPKIQMKQSIRLHYVEQRLRQRLEVMLNILKTPSSQT